jgi:hypothetical protein
VRWFFRRRWFVRLFLMLLLAIGILLVAVAVGWRGPTPVISDCFRHSADKEPYVVGNHAVFRAVPVFPGSRLIRETTDGQSYRDDCLWRVPFDTATSPAEEYWTTRTYAVSSQVTNQQTLRFFTKALREQGWKLYSWEIRSELKCGKPGTAQASHCHEVRHRNLCYSQYSRGKAWLILRICPHLRELSATVEYNHFERHPQQYP